MKVVHLSSVHSVYDTRITYKYGRSLARRGIDTHIVMLWRGEKVPKDIKAVKNLSVHFVANDIPSSRLARSTIGSLRVVLQARSLGADIYHLHDPELLPWARMFLPYPSRVVYDMHENLPLSIEDKLWIPRLFRSNSARIVSLLEAWLLANLNVVFAESSYQKWYPMLKRVRVVLNYPIFKELPNASPNSDRFLIGYVGGVTKSRGGLAMLEAVSKLQKRGWRVGLRCVGPIDDEFQRELNDYIRDESVEDVHFYGRMPLPAALKVLEECSVGIALLARTGNYEESIPTKILEYMGMGLPVISSDFPLYRQIVRGSDCGLTVEPTSSELEKALEWMIVNPSKRLEMSANGRTAVEQQYSWENEFEKIIECYREMMESFHRRPVGAWGVDAGLYP